MQQACSMNMQKACYIFYRKKVRAFSISAV
jgi:hypothetical protein